MLKISLKALRINAELTQEDVAENVEVTKRTVQNWESGKSAPDLKQIQKLCVLYNCSLDDIFLPDNIAKSEKRKEVIKSEN